MSSAEVIVNVDDGIVTSASSILAPKTNPVFQGTVTLDEDAVIVFEGASANNFETTLTVVDPGADRTISLPNLSGTLVVAESATFTADAIFNGNIIFEGAIGDAYETTLTVTEPTADRVITLPDSTTTLVGTDYLASQLASYQPLDADLTAIGALSGTAGILKKASANTWELDTNTYVNSSNVKTGTVTVTLSSGYGSATVNTFLSTQNVVASYKPAAGAYSSSSNTYSIAVETPADNTTRKFHVKSSNGSESGSVVLNYIAIA